MASFTGHFTAIVLAGDRGPHDPVATAAGVSCKAFTPVAGRPMIERVLGTLRESPSVEAYVLVGPGKKHLHEFPDLQQQIDSQCLRWTPPHTSPSSSAYNAFQTVPPNEPILLTTADHALLSPAMVEHFCSHARQSPSDVVIGFVDAQLVQQAYPASKRTILKFGEKGYCGCNLFAFLTPQGRKAAQFWQQMEHNRKKPWRLVGMFGWGPLVRYGLGKLTLEDALVELSNRIGISISSVMVPYPEAAIDVDSVGDWHHVEQIIREKDQAN